MTSLQQAVDCDVLTECGEFYAAGFFRDPESPTLIRMARALACHLAHVELPPWQGTSLYPDDVEREGANSHLYAGRSAVCFHYSIPMQWNAAALEQKIAGADTRSRQALLALQEALQEYPYFLEIGGFIHSSVNFRRVLSEGLNSYGARIRDHRAGNENVDSATFYEAMQITLDGIRAFHARVLAMLGEASAATPRVEQRRAALLEALQRVPFEPARSFYEAMVAENLIFYLDACDGLGRFDQDLYPYYAADLEAGRITRQEALSLIEDLWTNMNCICGWNVAIGGTAPDGSPGTNGLTSLCLEAARNRGGTKPNLALRLCEETPEEVWLEAFETLKTGIGQPALYCEENFLRAIRGCDLGVSEEDLPDFAFGGCTELMVHGKSCCGGADTHLNLPLVLDRFLHAHLVECRTFDELFDRFERALREAAHSSAEHTNRCYEQMARWQPQPMRSLLIDDCIDRGIEYHAGGARYNWSVVSVGGLANVADSLQALRDVVYGQRAISPPEMLRLLETDFEREEDVRRRLMQCARYGNDDDRVDELARRVAEIAFRSLLSRSTWRGGRFVPGCILLNWYVGWGQGVGALPDGRKADEPIADSAGPYQGRDRSGPTAMLSSVAGLPQHLAPGPLVLNARFSKDLFSEPALLPKFRDLIRTYFRRGGMQIQINVVDQETLRRALDDPEAYADLIVRVGGFSAYWQNLDDSYRRTILERAEHG